MADRRSPRTRARDEWFESFDGKACMHGECSGIFLHNRLEVAFLAGHAAALDPEPAGGRATDAEARALLHRVNELQIESKQGAVELLQTVIARGRDDG